MPNTWFQEELNLDHEPSLDHWARLIADLVQGRSDWDYEYEQAWNYLDAEFNYNYEYREYV
mgnify:CR=1 FL=1|tara:strand:- start:591 stop:773 length:183 start_codon:yes stop_codon:yes gene_type:complete